MHRASFIACTCMHQGSLVVTKAGAVCCSLKRRCGSYAQGILTVLQSAKKPLNKRDLKSAIGMVGDRAQVLVASLANRCALARSTQTFVLSSSRTLIDVACASRTISVPTRSFWPTSSRTPRAIWRSRGSTQVHPSKTTGCTHACKIA